MLLDPTTSSTVLLAMLVRDEHQVLIAVKNWFRGYFGIKKALEIPILPPEQIRRTSLQVRLSEVAQSLGLFTQFNLVRRTNMTFINPFKRHLSCFRELAQVYIALLVLSRRGEFRK